LSGLSDDALHRARRDSFDAVADSYASARPPYPDAVFEEIRRVVPPPASVLEIGPGPGVATLPMARRGYRVFGLELGENLARVARQRLAAFDGVEIVRADFHDWEPERDGAFDLVLAASAWHWIDPALGYPKARRALRRGGWLALVANHPRPGRLGSRSRAFWDETDKLYRRWAPTLVARRGSSPRALNDQRSEIRGSGCFVAVERHIWRWRRDFTAEAHIGLLDTYSDHRTLPKRERQRLYAAITRLAQERFAGVVPRQYRTIMYLARRVD
jgi:SAM-dependent methyltransferase